MNVGNSSSDLTGHEHADPTSGPTSNEVSTQQYETGDASVSILILSARFGSFANLSEAEVKPLKRVLIVSVQPKAVLKAHYNENGTSRP